MPDVNVEGRDGTPIEIFGVSGAQGRDGTDGTDGAPGAAGADGADGADGEEGPPGTPGTGGGSYHHSQALPSNIWTIVHGLDFYPNWTVIDSGGSEAFGSITHGSGTTVITFSAAFGGDAYGS